MFASCPDLNILYLPSLPNLAVAYRQPLAIHFIQFWISVLSSVPCGIEVAGILFDPPILKNYFFCLSFTICNKYSSS